MSKIVSDVKYKLSDEFSRYQTAPKRLEAGFMALEVAKVFIGLRLSVSNGLVADLDTSIVNRLHFEGLRAPLCLLSDVASDMETNDNNGLVYHSTSELFF